MKDWMQVMKKSAVSRESSVDSEASSSDENGPQILRLGSVSILTRGTDRPRTDDPNKWGDKAE